jgi:cobalt-precorrin-5B (C1)-methyltransferase
MGDRLTARSKGLRKGFTTGASAAAGTKAAAGALFSGNASIKRVSVTLPCGGSIDIPVKRVEVMGSVATATVVKDAGDDPDATDKAEIVAEVMLRERSAKRLSVGVKGGTGVGIVTMPGLKVRQGLPAINPVPMKMIRRSVREAAKEAGIRPRVIVTITVPRGVEIAKKTMNERLGIVGGISILGTTGIVEPLSLSAYRHSIDSAIDVADAGGLATVVFSTGRSSEKAVEGSLGLPKGSYILVGDHMGYALGRVAEKKGIKTVYVVAQFGKLTKLAAGDFETHCTDSSVDLGFIGGVCRRLNSGKGVVSEVIGANTARQVFFILKDNALKSVFSALCRMAKRNSGEILGSRVKVRCVLVGYENDIMAIA